MGRSTSRSSFLVRLCSSCSGHQSSSWRSAACPHSVIRRLHPLLCSGCFPAGFHPSAASCSKGSTPGGVGIEGGLFSFTQLACLLAYPGLPGAAKHAAAALLKGCLLRVGFLMALCTDACPSSPLCRSLNEPKGKPSAAGCQLILLCRYGHTLAICMHFQLAAAYDPLPPYPCCPQPLLFAAPCRWLRPSCRTQPLL